MKRILRHFGEPLGRRRRLVFAAGLAVLLAATAAGAAVRDHDRLFSYQLSYIEAKHAVEILTSLGYEAKNLDGEAEVSVLDIGDDAKRPVVFNLVGPGNVAIDGNTLPAVATGTAHQRLLIVWDDRDQDTFQRLLDLLHEKVDVAAKQILVEVLVIELDSGELEQLGASFTASQHGNSASFLADATTGGPLPFIYQFTRPSVRTVLNLTATLEALVEEGSARVLSQPSVLMLDGRRARVSVVDKSPYARVLSSTLDVSSRLVADTAYVDAGILLYLRARANDDDSAVTMRVVVDISSTGEGASAGGLVGPQVATRNVRTSVRVANNTPFVIGGLIRATENSSKGGVPGLSKIPGIGRLFSRSSKNKATSEVIVVITPHIIPPGDRSYTYTIPRDFDLFDYSDLELFRDIYRVKPSDVFDLDFISESEFIESLDRWVGKRAHEIYDSFSDKERWPPVASGNRAVLARNLRKAAADTPDDLASLVDPAAASGLEGRERQGALRKVPVGAFLEMLEGRIPGEDKFVKRMLIEIIEGSDQRPDLSRLVPDDKIVFFPAPEGDIRDTRTVILDPLDLFETLKEREPAAGDCSTDILSYRRGETSQLLPFDPPTAELASAVSISDPGRFRQELRERNQLDDAGAHWSRSAILLNDCYTTRGRSLRAHLKSVLVLKRLLDLNPTLPLTLDGFHVGRDIVLPAETDLRERHHLVDWEAARLFYETLDYYFAFEKTVRQVLETGVLEGLADDAPTTSATGTDDPRVEGGDSGSPGSSAEPAGESSTEVAAGSAPEGVGEPVEAAGPQGIADLVQAWAESWSAQDADEYLSFYAASFRPADGGAFDDWSAMRRARLEGPEFIEVQLSNLEINDLDPLGTRVGFTQQYRSDTYRDEVHKTLVLVLQTDEWKILAETAE